MLVKTNEKTKDGRDIYVNPFTLKKGPLGAHSFIPSQRSERRNRPALIKKVHTNRKATRGRKIYYQLIYQIREVFDKFKPRYNSKVMLLGIDRLTTKKLVLVRTIKHKVPNS
jgi:hypothetical protein